MAVYKGPTACMVFYIQKKIGLSEAMLADTLLHHSYPEFRSIEYFHIQPDSKLNTVTSCAEAGWTTFLILFNTSQVRQPTSGTTSGF